MCKQNNTFCVNENDTDTLGSNYIPAYIKEPLRRQANLNIDLSSKRQIKKAQKQEAARLAKAYDKLLEIKKATLEEEHALLRSNKLKEHIKNVLVREVKNGLCEHAKSPVFYRELAKIIGFSHNNYDNDQSPWFIGHKTLGALEPLNELFPNAKSLADWEKDWLDSYDEDIVNAADFLKAKIPEPQDPELCRKGFAHWHEILVDGVRFLIPDDISLELPLTSYCFYSPTSKGKIRCICNEKPRNELFNPASAHMTLVSHKDIAAIAAFCLDPDAKPVFFTEKSDIQNQIKSEKQKGKRPVWDDIVPQALKSPKARGFIPSLGKLDKSNAYYQLPVFDPHQNAVALHDGDFWHYYLSCVLTFGSRHSAQHFQTFSEFVCRILAYFLGIAARPYIDDVIRFSHPAFAELHQDYMRKTVKLLGFTISQKYDGDITGVENEDVEILGLIYNYSNKKLTVRAEKKRIESITSEINNALAQLTAGLPLAKKQIQKILGQVNFVQSHRQFKTEGPLTALLCSALATENPEISPANNQFLIATLELLKEKLQSDFSYCFEISHDTLLKERVTLFTDASLSRRKCGLAGVLHSTKGTHYYACKSVPQKLPKELRNSNIQDLELLAVLVAVETLPLEGKHISLFVDNVGAAHSLRRGTNRNSRSAALVAHIHKTLSRKGCSVQYLYISTHRNPADEPSRTGALKAACNLKDATLVSHNFDCKPLFKTINDLTSLNHALAREPATSSRKPGASRAEKRARSTRSLSLRPASFSRVSSDKKRALGKLSLLLKRFRPTRKTS